MGYMVFLKDGPHHQLMKVEKKFKKDKKKKEKKPKHESFATFGEWVSGGEESSTSSSDWCYSKYPSYYAKKCNLVVSVLYDWTCPPWFESLTHHECLYFLGFISELASMGHTLIHA